MQPLVLQIHEPAQQPDEGALHRQQRLDGAQLTRGHQPLQAGDQHQLEQRVQEAHHQHGGHQTDGAGCEAIGQAGDRQQIPEACRQREQGQRDASAQQMAAQQPSQ